MLDTTAATFFVLDSFPQRFWSDVDIGTASIILITGIFKAIYSVLTRLDERPCTFLGTHVLQIPFLSNAIEPKSDQK